jgi:hypothetical protein
VVKTTRPMARQPGRDRTRTARQSMHGMWQHAMLCWGLRDQKKTVNYSSYLSGALFRGIQMVLSLRICYLFTAFYVFVYNCKCKCAMNSFTS